MLYSFTVALCSEVIPRHFIPRIIGIIDSYVDIYCNKFWDQFNTKISNWISDVSCAKDSYIKVLDLSFPEYEIAL